MVQDPASFAALKRSDHANVSCFKYINHMNCSCDIVGALMASLEAAFKRHSRAQTASIPVAHDSATPKESLESSQSTPLPAPAAAMRADSVIRRTRVLNAQS